MCRGRVIVGTGSIKATGRPALSTTPRNSATSTGLNRIQEIRLLLSALPLATSVTTEQIPGGSGGYMRPVRIMFQYSQGRPRRLRYHMSVRSWVVSISGMLGAGCMV